MCCYRHTVFSFCFSSLRLALFFHLVFFFFHLRWWLYARNVICVCISAFMAWLALRSWGEVLQNFASAAAFCPMHTRWLIIILLKWENLDFAFWMIYNHTWRVLDSMRREVVETVLHRAANEMKCGEHGCAANTDDSKANKKQVHWMLWMGMWRDNKPHW